MLRTIWNERDWPSAIFLTALAGTALWVCLLPISSYVQRAYLKRFHLRTSSYAGWAAQQLTPAMYNLENTYWYSNQPLSEPQRNDLANQYFSQLHGRPGQPELENVADQQQVMLDMLNHFPTRTITFVQSRQFLKQHRTGYFYFRSRYRNEELETLIKVTPISQQKSTIVKQDLGPVGGTQP